VIEKLPSNEDILFQIRAFSDMFQRFVVFFISAFFITTCFAALNAQEDEKDTNTGNTLKLDERGNIPTFNKYGFAQKEEFFIDRFTKDFVIFAVENKERRCLEIGAGFANLSLEVLRQGGKVVINDLERKHLDVVRKRIPKILRPNAELVVGAFPNELNFTDKSLDAVFCRVFQFLNGKEIEHGLAKIKRWLKPGGKLYVVAPSIHMTSVNKRVYKSFIMKRKAKDPWPGLNVPTKEIYPSDVAYNMPERVHVFDLDTLVNVMIRTDFDVQRVSYFDKFNRLNSINGTDKQSIGIIATPMSE